MKITFLRVYKKIIDWLIVPILFFDFVGQKTSPDLQIGFFAKAKLFFQVFRMPRKIRSATSCQEHLLMCLRLLSLPSSLEGDAAECGSFLGSSSASLSLACRLAKRKLFLFDSFEGLPEPQEDQNQYLPHLSKQVVYQKGQYAGSLETVRNNIKKFGALEVCQFVKGNFQDTLPHFLAANQTLCFVFLDVDLPSSLMVCLKNLWPLLQKNGFLFTHEAQNLDFVSRFFQPQWWLENIKSKAPGLIGAGLGLSYNTSFTSPLAYIKKND